MQNLQLRRCMAHGVSHGAEKTPILLPNGMRHAYKNNVPVIQREVKSDSDECSEESPCKWQLVI